MVAATPGKPAGDPGSDRLCHLPEGPGVSSPCGRRSSLRPAPLECHATGRSLRTGRATRPGRRGDTCLLPALASRSGAVAVGVDGPFAEAGDHPRVVRFVHVGGCARVRYRDYLRPGAHPRHILAGHRLVAERISRTLEDEPGGCVRRQVAECRAAAVAGGDCCGCGRWRWVRGRACLRRCSGRGRRYPRRRRGSGGSFGGSNFRC